VSPASITQGISLRTDGFTPCPVGIDLPRPARWNDPGGRKVGSLGKREDAAADPQHRRPFQPQARYLVYPHIMECSMAIEVRIPTILRTYTDGAKQVEGAGSTLSELIEDIDARHSGLRDRLVADGGLRRFVNVYLNDEDVRFLGGLETPVKDGDTVTVLPAVAGGAA